MKKAIIFLLLSGIIYLSSCGNGSNDKLPPIPVADSMTKGSNLQISYLNDSGSITSYSFQDYTVNNVAVYSLFATIIYSTGDSLWHCKIQLVDLKTKDMGIELNLTNTSSTGTYTVVTNNSSLIEYNNGENSTYNVSIGSTVEITQSSYPITGSMNLMLYRNHFSTNATGGFKIYY